METVGDFLRQVRETKGLTLDEVASKTRIHPEFLKALEEGNFAKLPEQVFAKGFVRSYARSLGLDEEDAVRRFTESAGAFYGKQTELERLRVQQVEDERRKKANRKVVMAAVGVALLGLVMLLAREQNAVVSKRPMTDSQQFGADGSRSGSRSARPPVAREAAGPTASSASAHSAPSAAPPSATTAAQPAGLPTPAQTQPTAEHPAAERSERDAPVAAVAPSPLSPSASPLPIEVTTSHEAPLVLGLEAMELTWVVVQVDGGSPLEALLRPGERVTWKATDKFVVTLGNAGGVKVELNGKPQGPFGPSGRVARDIVLKRG